MRILGIDPGVAIVGFGLIESERGSVRMLQYGAVTTPAGLPLATRLVQIENDMTELIRQLKLAAECDLPISIHMRDATADCLDLLKTYAKTPFVMHCFSGSVETAMEVVRMGGYISFAGPLTFKNARALPEVAKIVPAERILCETDCPYLTPVPHRGKENEPMYVRFTFDKICELRNADPQRMSEQILQNYHRFLGK